MEHVEMAKKLFVGGLSWDTTEEGLRAAFEVYGELSGATRQCRSDGKGGADTL